MSETDRIATWTLLGTAPLNLTLSGTAQAFSATALYVRGFMVQAESGNSGIIRVGSALVSATFGHELVPGEVFTLIPPQIDGKDQIINLADVYFDGDTTNDDITVSYLLNR
jgi:hypothetical protein